jgi:hypothetical protein
MIMARINKAALSVVLAFVLVAVPTAFGQTAGYDFERILNKQYDWLLYCDMETVPNYMQYKGSPMNPIVRFIVKYRVTNHFQRNAMPDNPIKYEEIWYHDGKAVGLKRYTDFFPSTMQQGALYFRSLGDAQVTDYTREVANLAVRLTMDVYCKRSIMAAAIVPAGAFENVASYLQYYNFFTLEEASGGRGENMSLHMLSFPRTKDRYFYYDDTGRR